MKKYKLWFDKNDTPFNKDFQKHRKYHVVWKRTPYVNGFLRHRPIKVKLFGLITIFDKKHPNRNIKGFFKIKGLSKTTKKVCCECGNKADFKIVTKNYDGKDAFYICQDCHRKRLNEIFGKGKE